MIARGLLDAGARIVISSRKEADLNATADELSTHGDCVPIPADLSGPDGARRLAEAVAERFPELSILVNNAGATWGAPLDEFPQSRLRCCRSCARPPPPTIRRASSTSARSTASEYRRPRTTATARARPRC